MSLPAAMAAVCRTDWGSINLGFGSMVLVVDMFAPLSLVHQYRSSGSSGNLHEKQTRMDLFSLIGTYFSLETICLHNKAGVTFVDGDLFLSRNNLFS